MLKRQRSGSFIVHEPERKRRYGQERDRGDPMDELSEEDMPMLGYLTNMFQEAQAINAPSIIPSGTYFISRDSHFLTFSDSNNECLRYL